MKKNSLPVLVGLRCAICSNLFSQVTYEILRRH